MKTQEKCSPQKSTYQWFFDPKLYKLLLILPCPAILSITIVQTERGKQIKWLEKRLKWYDPGSKSFYRLPIFILRLTQLS